MREVDSAVWPSDREVAWTRALPIGESCGLNGGTKSVKAPPKSAIPESTDTADDDREIGSIGEARASPASGPMMSRADLPEVTDTAAMSMSALPELPDTADEDRESEARAGPRETPARGEPQAIAPGPIISRSALPE